MASPWEQEVKEYRDAGMPDDVIGQEEKRVRGEMFDSGVPGVEIDKYFGVQPFDDKPVKEFLQSAADEVPADETGKRDPEKQAQNIWDQFKSGFKFGDQMSVSGLKNRGKLPDENLPEDPGMAMRIGAASGQFMGDLPYMLTGMVGGGVAGTGVPGVGNALGAMAGAVAVPAAMRRHYIDSIQKGSIKDWGDYWERSGGIIMDFMKGGLTGYLTGMAGSYAAYGTLGKASAELLTMTTVGKALEGQVPEPSEFLDGAVFLTGLHAVTHVTSLPFKTKAVGEVLQNTYAETGVRPAEVVEKAQNDANLRAELLSEGPNQGRIAGLLEVGRQKLSTESGAIKLPEPPKIERSEAVAKVMSKFGVKEEAQKAPLTTSKLYTEMFDKLNPIEDFVKSLDFEKGQLPADQNPAVLARMVNDSPAKLEHFVKYGTIGADGTVKGPGLEEVLKPVAKDLDLLNATLTARRVVEKAAQGVEAFTGDPEILAASKATIAEAGFEYEKAAKGYTRWRNEGTQYGVESGLIDPKDYKTWEEMGQAYADFARIINPEDRAVGDRPSKHSSFKKFEGSSKLIERPLTAGIKSTEAIIRMSDKNRVMRAAIELANTPRNAVIDDYFNSGPKVFEEVPQQMKVTKSSVDEVKAWMDKNGIKGDPVAFETFRAQMHTLHNLAENQVGYVDKGKLRVFKTDVEFAKAIKSLDGNPTQPLFIKFMSVFTGAVKFGTTFTPDFIASNAGRDLLTGTTFSKGKINPLDILNALGELMDAEARPKIPGLAKKPVDVEGPYARWKRSGGAQGTFIKPEEVDLIKKIYALDKETNLLDSAWNVVQKPVDFVKMLGRIVESGPRLAEFTKVSQGAGSGPKLIEAGAAAKEVTVDFDRMGGFLSRTHANSVTAFMNVGMQGLDRSVRAVKENPKATFYRGVSLLTIPSIVLWTINRDKPWYKKLQQWERDAYWHIEVPGISSPIKIKKPQEVGLLFASLPERMMESVFANNPRAFDEFQKTIMNLVTPSFIPDFFKPMVEQAFNKDTFTGNPIVSETIKNQLPAYQYNDYTSDTARVLGKLIQDLPAIKDLGPDGVKLPAPVVMENYAKKYGGTWGRYLLKATDQLLYKMGIAEDFKPANTAADMPFVQSYVTRQNSANTQNISNFRKRYAEALQPVTTIDKLEKAGQLEEAAKLRDRYQADLQVWGGLRVIDAGLQEAGKELRMLHAMPLIESGHKNGISKDDKRRLMDSVYFAMDQMVKTGMDQIDALDKQYKDLKLQKMVP